MSTGQDGTTLALELPLMYIEAGRTLVQVYATFDELSTLDALRRGVQEAGAVTRTLYAYYQPERGNFLGQLTIDATGAATPADLTRKLAAIPGVNLIQTIPPASALTAAERSTLQVAGTPMVVMAKEVIGGAFQHFYQACPPNTVYETGLQMGKLAAVAVPPLLDRLGLPLTLDLLRRRLLDFQVFGWAEVRRIDLTESLQGVLELSQTFESVPWKGRSDHATCDFIRGFASGVFSFAYNRDFTSEELVCQGKGDPLCRISFRPAA